MKKILIMGLATLMLLTGCRSRENVSIEKSTTEKGTTETPTIFGGPEPWYITIAVPEELLEYVEMYAGAYVENEMSEEDKELMTMRFEVVEADTVVEAMNTGLNEDGYFYDIYFCYDEQLSEIVEIGGCAYSVRTEYLDKNERYLTIGLLPQGTAFERDIKKDMINYLVEQIETEYGTHFPEVEQTME